MSIKEGIERNGGINYGNPQQFHFIFRIEKGKTEIPDFLPPQYILSTFQCSREHCCNPTSNSEFSKCRVTGILKAVYSVYSPVIITQAVPIIIHNNLTVFLLQLKAHTIPIAMFEVWDMKILSGYYIEKGQKAKLNFHRICSIILLPMLRHNFI